MTEYDNTNRGTLGKNDRKEQPSHADYRGKLNVEGREYWLNAWIKEGPNGKFFSLSVKPKDDQPKDMNSKARNSYTPGGKVVREDPISTGRGRNEDMNDDIPF